MSIFIDAGIYIAYVNEKDKLHSEASDLIDGIMENKHGAAFTSNAVFDEVVTFLLYKTGDVRNASRARDLILGDKEKGMPQFMNLLFVDKEVLNKGWNIFVKYANKKLSFTDCTTIELMNSRDIEHLASFDGGFDGIVARIIE
ncbi:MAG: PIN domain-containing protein [Candidatus Methanoperedens sp.]|nr:PIN domain-containing protein [Candidatus Methanoperedens sp.]MCZ7368984.1 PIN domain-containing protein [Candidatus Methanoperedens sp.]